MLYRLFAGLLLLITIFCAGAMLLGHMLPSGILAFTSDRSGRFQVYIVDVDRMITVPITRDQENYGSPAWSNSGDLAFVMAQPLGRDIVILNPFTGISCAINGRLLDEFAPAWSADGQLSYIVGLSGNYDIYVQQGCDGRTARPVATGFRSAYRPRWSNDGRLVFADGTGETPQIIVYDVSTGDNLSISQRGTIGVDPVWVGESLVAFLRVTSNREIFLYDLATGEARNVSQNRSDDRALEASSDGWLAFLSNRDGNNEVYVYNIASDTLTNVSRSMANDTLPSWSSDGRLAYISALSSVYDIMVLDQVPDGTPRLVVQHPAHDFNPVWMP